MDSFLNKGTTFMETVTAMFAVSIKVDHYEQFNRSDDYVKAELFFYDQTKG